ncbi:hypothetical protein [Actinoalloteichus hymeniacidonis]|uniref:Uncharacterized protein n=1 Tax=Actinoalloteichus hymeniacidonis TaxID=340345 RepID=A0AAC9HP31_9PSEU|nr:hypothetical protein [Actinoalloteichus hymeniacidonis]AOS62929.1 hypothetical protein TL08_10575 [Actinoalloteichus hymeniacidonis]MBB5909038.1 hypothetical protein [Actinoalloteichus hymeniacidonis]
MSVDQWPPVDPAPTQSSTTNRSYELRVAGRSVYRIAQVFPEMSVGRNTQEAILRGTILDDAALHSLLVRVQTLGLRLLSIHQVPSISDPESSTGDSGPPATSAAAPAVTPESRRRPSSSKRRSASRTG